MGSYKFVHDGVRFHGLGWTAISEPIKVLKENYGFITGAHAICKRPDGVTTMVQAAVDSDGVIFCDVNEANAGSSAHIIIDYEK